MTPEKAAANEKTLVHLNEEFAALGNQLRELSAALGAKKEDREKLSEKSNRVKNDVNVLFMVSLVRIFKFPITMYIIQRVCVYCRN